MRIYLAGASAEIERCEGALWTLREAGHRITFDWCAHMRKLGPDAGCSAIDLEEAGKLDLLGIDDADTFILLVPSKPSTGCWIEYGYALNSREWREQEAVVELDIVWVGPRFGPFVSRADYQCDTLAEALAYLAAVPVFEARS